MADAQSADQLGDIQKEVDQSQKAMADAFNSLNHAKPLKVNNGTSGGTASEDSSGLQNLLAQPALQKYVKLVSKPQFREDLSAVVNHPNRVRCLEAELGWFFFILILRQWRYSKSKSWTGNIWIYLWATVLLWLGALYFVPHYFFGAPFDRLTYEIAATIKGN
jgi:hypothetical protein